MKVEHLKVVGFPEAIRGMRNPKNSWKKSDTYISNNVFPGSVEYHEKVRSFPITPEMKDNEFIEKTIHSSNDVILYNPWLQKYKINKSNNENTNYPIHEDIYIDTDNVVLIGDNDIDLMQRLVSHDNTIINGGEPNAKFLRYIAVYVDITASFDFWKEFDTYKVGTVSDSCSTMHTITKHPITLDNFSLNDLREKDIDMIKRNIDYYNNDVLNDDSLSDLEKTRIMSKLNLLGFEQKRTILLNYQVLKNMNIWRSGHKLKEWRILTNVYFKNLPYVKSLFLNNPYLIKKNTQQEK